MKVFWFYFWAAVASGLIGTVIIAIRTGEWDSPFLLLAIALALAAVIEGSNSVSD